MPKERRRACRGAGAARGAGTLVYGAPQANAAPARPRARYPQPQRVPPAVQALAVARGTPRRRIGFSGEGARPADGLCLRRTPGRG